MNVHFRKYIMLSFVLVGIHTFSTLIAEMTQTDAHLSIPQNKAMVDKWYNMEKNTFYREMYEKTNTMEKKYLKSHYVFYNGFTNEWRVPQDLYIKLAAKLYPNTFGGKVDAFRAFRWLPVDYKTPKQFLKDELLNHGLVNDNEWRVKAYLLSTNLALFGNVGFTGECTFEYFLDAKSNTSVDEAIFKSILDIFDNPESYDSGKTPILYKYIPKLQKLGNYLISQPFTSSDKRTFTPQTLSQIFIPKSLVDEVAYTAWVQGNPYDAQLANWLETELNVAPGKTPTYAKSKDWLENVRELFKDKQTSHPLFRKILSRIEKGTYSISSTLNAYRNTPALIPGLNHLQARIMVTPQYINKGSDIKVFDYDRISAANKAKYNSELNAIVNSIVKDILAQAKKQLAGTGPKISVPKGTANATVATLTGVMDEIDQAVMQVISNAAAYRASSYLKDKMISAVAASNILLMSQYAAVNMSMKDVILANNIPLAFVAVGTNNPEVINRAVKNEIDLNAGYVTPQKVVVYPIDYAVWKKQDAVIKALRNNGASIHPQTTALAKSLGVTLK